MSEYDWRAEWQTETWQRIQDAETDLGPVADSWRASDQDRMAALKVLTNAYSMAVIAFQDTPTGAILRRAESGLIGEMVDLAQVHGRNWSESVGRDLDTLSGELGDRAYRALIGAGAR